MSAMANNEILRVISIEGSSNLWTKKSENHYFWCIGEKEMIVKEDYHWTEITKKLYDCLRSESDRNNQQKIRQDL